MEKKTASKKVTEKRTGRTEKKILLENFGRITEFESILKYWILNIDMVGLDESEPNACGLDVRLSPKEKAVEVEAGTIYKPNLSKH